MVVSYLVLASISVVCWSPVLIRFYRNWMRRHNPISLAICAAVLLLMWIAIAGIWEIAGDMRGEIVTFSSTAVSLLVAAYANFTFYLADKRFKEKRSE